MAAAVSIVITVSSVLVIGQLGLVTGQPALDTPNRAAATQSGRTWEAQRAQQSLSGIRLERMRAYQKSPTFSEAGREWERQREQQSPGH